MLLHNLLSVQDNRSIDIYIENETISGIDHSGNIEYPEAKNTGIKFENAIVFPGLINSHDHLDFNSFPQLGNKTYSNYVEWGNDIHSNNKSQISRVLQIPHHLRVQWGIYKNLLNGITTVVNHGPELCLGNEPISIFQQCNILHSVQLEKNWIYKLNKPGKGNLPVVVHIGEGTDLSAKQEIDSLLKWNLLRKKLIGVHAVAMNEKQAKRFEAIIWCPDSNNFLLGKTADISFLKKQTRILFGTDSTVSADWNLWNHLKLGRTSKMASDTEIYNMLTKNAAEVWNLKLQGELKKDNFADLVVAKAKNNTSALDSFFDVQPEDILLVMHKGKIRLFDESIYAFLQDQKYDLQEFHGVNLSNSRKFVWGNLPAIMSEIRQYHPEAEFPVN